MYTATDRNIHTQDLLLQRERQGNFLTGEINLFVTPPTYVITRSWSFSRISLVLLIILKDRTRGPQRVLIVNYYD